MIAKPQLFIAHCTDQLKTKGRECVWSGEAAAFDLPSVAGLTDDSDLIALKFAITKT